MRLWVNILSACNECAEHQLPRLAFEMEPVKVYSTLETRFIGRAVQAEIRNRVDLWAELDLDVHVPFKRAAAVLDKYACGAPLIIAIMATDLSREDIRRLFTSKAN